MDFTSNDFCSGWPGVVDKQLHVPSLNVGAVANIPDPILLKNNSIFIAASDRRIHDIHIQEIKKDGEAVSLQLKTNPKS